jgi:mannose-6-phosphate isomerase-like protein (cupin superfamily)
MIIRDAASRAVFSAEKMGKVSLVAGEYLYVGLNCFLPGQQHAAHVHLDQDKLYFVLEGSGVATIGESSEIVSPGDLIFAPAGVSHALSNSGPGNLVVATLFAPPPPRR